jgi:hypothetical protein
MIRRYLCQCTCDQNNDCCSVPENGLTVGMISPPFATPYHLVCLFSLHERVCPSHVECP